MRKIIFLANCNSPHLDRWLNLLKMMDLEVEVWSIHNCEGKDYAKQLLPSFSHFLPTILKYILAGILLRFKRHQSVLHAHNTSGYGLTALLSGKKYIITTYGSEIFSARDRNKLYKALIQRVLDKSIVITSTSEEMKDALKTYFNIDTKKIHNFSLGVDTKTFTFLKKTNHEIKTWVVNRRMHPHYHTLETIEGFIAFLEAGYKGNLIVLMGDYDLDYAQKISDKIDFKRYKERISCVKDFLDRKDLAVFLKKSTFSISTPKSDQLSSSILESMACGTIPVLSRLESYKKIINSQSCLVIDNYIASSFKDFFILSATMSPEECDKIAQNGLVYIENNESSEAVQGHIKNMYMISGLIQDHSRNRENCVYCNKRLDSK